MNPGITEALIWATALCVAALAGLWMALRTLRSLDTVRQAVRDSAQEQAVAERDVALEKARLDLDARRHELTLQQETIGEATAARKAELDAQTAKYQLDREAAGLVVEEAAEALRAELKATGEARAAVALDRARNEAEGTSVDWAVAKEMYARYLSKYGGTQPLPFGKWMQGWDCCGAK